MYGNEVSRLEYCFNYRKHLPIFHFSRTKIDIRSPVDTIRNMSKLSLFKNFKPSLILSAINNRGMTGFTLHSLRRLGSMYEFVLMGPDTLRINPIGAQCNHACPMCWIRQVEPDERNRLFREDRENAMNLADYRSLFNGMPVGLHEVNVVGGGEPLLHREIIPILTAVKEHGWVGSLITNGTLMTKSVSDDLVRIRWDNVRVSVNGGDRETYHKIQGVDRFDLMRDNLRYYDQIRRRQSGSNRGRLSAFHVIQRDNLDSIDRLFDISEEIGADTIEFAAIIPFDPGAQLTADEQTRAVDTLNYCAQRSPVPCNLSEIVRQLSPATGEDNDAFRPARFCSVGFDQTFILSNGNVMPCCFSTEVLGNVREMSFKDIWRGEKYQKFRIRLIRGKFARYCIECQCALPGVLHN